MKRDDPRQEWETPPELFAKLAEIFNFTLDVCASIANSKTHAFLSAEQNGLSRDWFYSGTRAVWCNPPFGDIGRWLDWAIIQTQTYPHGTAVVLSPVDTSTRWWHDYATQAAEIWFLTPRVKFIPPSPDIKASNGPAGAHCLLVYRNLPNGATRRQAIVNWRWR